MNARCARVEEALGAYVLGACPPPEAEPIAAHLEQCGACARTAARLRDGADALLATLPAVTPAPVVKRRVMERVRADASLFDAARTAAPAARSWRPARSLALACALFIALVTAVAGLGLPAGGDDGPKVLVASIDAEMAPGAAASLEVRDGGLRLEARGLPAPGRGRAYQVWVRQGRGAPRPAGAVMRPAGDDRREAALPPGKRQPDQVLVTSEPLGGSEIPTRPPVLRVDL